MRIRLEAASPSQGENRDRCEEIAEAKIYGNRSHRGGTLMLFSARSEREHSTSMSADLIHVQLRVPRPSFSTGMHWMF